MNTEAGTTVTESVEQRMASLFAEFHEISTKRNELVRAWAGPEFSLSGVSGAGTEQRLNDRRLLDDTIAQMEARQKELYDESVSLGEGKDVTALYKNWMQENGKSN
jgi:hypothetical protein